MNSKKITVIAQFDINPNSIELMKTKFNQLVKNSRSESGCITYELNQDNKNPNSFLIYEIWESKEHWEEHMKTESFLEFKNSTEDLINKLVVSDMTSLR